MPSRYKYLKRFVTTVSICIFTFLEDCRAWKVQTVSHDINVENGVESNIDFFLTDYRSLNGSIRIIVQHRSSNGSFSKKCRIDHSDTGVCQPTLGPCECVGESSGSYRYRLRMTFREPDGGQWVFTTGNNEEMFVNITVIPRRAFKIYTKSKSITVENGLKSNVDFFLNDSTAVDIGVRIVVQHQNVGGVTFDPKCHIHHSKTGGCQILFGPCECIGERSETYQYRLRMVFTQQDGGLWKFDIVSHEGTIVNITVIGQQSTERPEVKGLTPVISVITVIAILIIISLVAVLRCRARSEHTLEGEAAQMNEITEINSMDCQLYHILDKVEYVDHVTQTLRESLSRDGQSADRLGQSTDVGDVQLYTVVEMLQ
ncbi:uncharacterized protein LOC112576091 [Pomacea canaliculata]|uniref:uncharacterized protein LOC112576091 n=1 Tax=Pomacea canaliculata TaxID=400727 RepID=UPI000D73926F|nr:uncharacterized protein LOC112576091 [Pomacea canaliculata]